MSEPIGFHERKQASVLQGAGETCGRCLGNGKDVNIEVFDAAQRSYILSSVGLGYVGGSGRPDALRQQLPLHVVGVFLGQNWRYDQCNE